MDIFFCAFNTLPLFLLLLRQPDDDDCDSEYIWLLIHKRLAADGWVEL